MTDTTLRPGTRVQIIADGIDRGRRATVERLSPLAEGGRLYWLRRQPDGFTLCYYANSIPVEAGEPRKAAP